MDINKRIKSLIPARLKSLLKVITNRDLIRSYSQFGEDAYLLAYFKGKTWRYGSSMHLPKDGFYVDIGAYSPTECPNTFLFYRQGWNGINIDATPGVMESFDLVRRRDVNLNLAIGSQAKTITFYCWGAPSVFNTADPELAEQRARDLGTKPEIISVPCMTMAEVLDQYLPKGKKIDFLTVDVEGLDLEVLKSNNWDEYRPELIVAEIYTTSLEDIPGTGLYQFLQSQDYECIAWPRPSIIFHDTRKT